MYFLPEILWKLRLLKGPLWLGASFSFACTAPGCDQFTEADFLTSDSVSVPQRGWKWRCNILGALHTLAGELGQDAVLYKTCLWTLLGTVWLCWVSVSDSGMWGMGSQGKARSALGTAYLRHLNDARVHLITCSFPQRLSKKCLSSWIGFIFTINGSYK